MPDPTNLRCASSVCRPDQWQRTEIGRRKVASRWQPPGRDQSRHSSTIGHAAVRPVEDRDSSEHLCDQSGIATVVAQT